MSDEHEVTEAIAAAGGPVGDPMEEATKYVDAVFGEEDPLRSVDEEEHPSELEPERTAAVLLELRFRGERKKV